MIRLTLACQGLLHFHSKKYTLEIGQCSDASTEKHNLSLYLSSVGRDQVLAEDELITRSELGDILIPVMDLFECKIVLLYKGKY